MKTTKKKGKKNNNHATLEAILNDRAVRQAVARESHLMFFNIYFPSYVKYEMAEFHKDIFRITEDQSNKLACIMAFRGSGKSTIVTFSYTLWAILGIQQKKFALIICQTQAQAKQAMKNIRNELETNSYLKTDLGPFQEESGEWAISSIVFKNTGARIMIASLEQSIRGVRHHEHRPDLIILDDVEDVNSTKTYESRQKNFEWFTREIIPLGDMGTRIIIVGNLLHDDSLVMRLKDRITAKKIDGVFCQFPLLDENEKCLWPGKFDTAEKIEELHRSVASEFAWQQEYLLNPAADEACVIHPSWIKHYDEIMEAPPKSYPAIYTAIDVAISLKDTADYTAMVSAKIMCYGNDIKIYILPNPVNERLDFPTMQTRIKKLHEFNGNSQYNTIFVESVQAQDFLVQALRGLILPIQGVIPQGDKRERLSLASKFVFNGNILFPRNGAEDLIRQLVGFGMERHDDLADAFSMLILKIVELRPARDPSCSLWELNKDSFTSRKWPCDYAGLGNIMAKKF